MNPKESLSQVLVLTACMTFGSLTAFAQPAGWTDAAPIVITETSGSALTGYPVRMTLDTTGMQPGAADLRFGSDMAGTTLLDHWIESGAGTSSTVVWVKLPALPASGQVVIYRFGGNPAATSTSTLNVFDFSDMLTNSATQQVGNDTAGNGSGGVVDSQRGFRFAPNQDILVTDFGKFEPNGSARHVTLFDFDTQAVLAQVQVSGPAAQYSYQALPQPIWLTAGHQYLLVMHQGSADGYYFRNSAQVSPLITYLDMRYCNGCSESTFPTMVLSNWHYGYSDFLFRTRPQAASEPSYVLNPALPSVPTALAAVPGNAQIRLTFAPPASGTSPFSAYTATCTPQGGGAPVTQSGTGSPLDVAGLTNGLTYACAVSATNALGTGPASAPVMATPAGPVIGHAVPVPGLGHWAMAWLGLLAAALAGKTLRSNRRSGA